MDTRGQISGLFRREGMNPKEISYDDALDMYDVSIGVEGTDRRFTNRSDSDGTEPLINTDELKAMKKKLQGAEIPDGRVVVRYMLSGSHFKIEVH